VLVQAFNNKLSLETDTHCPVPKLGLLRKLLLMTENTRNLFYLVIFIHVGRFWTWDKVQKAELIKVCMRLNGVRS